jgi:hypothetical protein
MKTINTLLIGLLFSSAVSAQKFPFKIRFVTMKAMD